MKGRNYWSRFQRLANASWARTNAHQANNRNQGLPNDEISVAIRVRAAELFAIMRERKNFNDE